MITNLYIATTVGLMILTPSGGSWQISEHVLKNQSLTSVAVIGDIVLAGTSDGIVRSADNGKTWQRIHRKPSPQHVRWMTKLSRTPTTILVGTEPADIFISRDSGMNWHSVPEVGKLRDTLGWFLPYSDGAGCVRGFAVYEGGRDMIRLYAAVEVGGVLRSDDGGNSWRLVEGSDGIPDLNRDLGSNVHPDVHSLSVHRSSPELVTAATGGGLYRSTDGGRTWRNIYHCYIRAVWVDPEDAQHIIAGPADGVSWNGRIEETRNGGKTWTSANTGTKAPWARHMVNRFVPVDRKLFAVLSNGQLWARDLSDAEWRRILPEIDSVIAVAYNN